MHTIERGQNLIYRSDSKLAEVNGNLSVKFSRVWIIKKKKKVLRALWLNERSKSFPKIQLLFIYLSLKQEKTAYESDRLSYASILTLFQNTVSLMREDVRLFITCCYTINGGACLPQGSA